MGAIGSVTTVPSAREQIAAALQQRNSGGSDGAQAQIDASLRAQTSGGNGAQAQIKEALKANTSGNGSTVTAPSTQQAIREGAVDVMRFVERTQTLFQPMALQKIAQIRQEVAQIVARDKVDLSKPPPRATKPAPVSRHVDHYA